MANLTPSPIGERLGQLVEIAGISLRRLDALAGKPTPGYAQQITSGVRQSPRPDILRPYAQVLGCSVAWLLLGEGEAPSDDAVKAAVAEAEARANGAEAVGGEHRGAEPTAA